MQNRFLQIIKKTSKIYNEIKIVMQKRFPSIIKISSKIYNEIKIEMQNIISNPFRIFLFFKIF